MALFINTNTASINAARNLTLSTGALNNTSRALASGYRINSAKDDAAGLQISNRLTSQINGLNQGSRNAMDGISMLQTAEGAMDELTNSLQRIRTLAIQSANGTNSASEREALQQEVYALSAGINSTAANTTYGGRPLLAGECTFDVRPQDATTASVWAVTHALPGHTDYKRIDPTCADSKIDLQTGADSGGIISTRLALTATIPLHHFDYNNVPQCVNYPSHKDEPVNMGFDLNSLYLYSKTKDGCVLSNAPIEARTTGFTVGTDGYVSFDVLTPEAAQKTITNMGTFIDAISGARAELGATQNRLESAIRNQMNTSENVNDARSRIRDTDYAVKTSELAQANIMEQASQTILSQANAIPEIALKLLQGLQ